MSDAAKLTDQPDDGPELSVVIPIYNEEAILEASVTELVAELDDAGVDFEILLAENGSSDATVAIAERLAARWPKRLRWFSYPEPNYGGALREAIFRARGTFVICEEIDLCDVDFHARALELLRRDEADLVVGSKAMAGAHDKRPLARRTATKVYNKLLRVSLGFSGTDTHGLKAMRRSVVAPVAARCVVDYDVFASELVIRAEREGLRVLEIPIELEEKRAPSIHLARRVPRVLGNLGRLMVSIHLGKDIGRESRRRRS
ncbi:undecaprenyl phosphate 4-deoxy-4-formamido-L-arabinose transferase [Enhygromyxa salina]|uniref:Undecaprenyl phosphate 4-deoxy-4-formamido-L-arabinose transferase n=1 Tax=Enhygromyxa salina TaxID=215803 RepID=A0A2S9YCU2_9BACT|nr:glycosyltransferase family 2 protein [Enhygromyxa salina]PRQ02934.1 undecaprenyl phosphate 4-deoxy-4-formamido-L-arabinose transferase [Enhygromyxa salina]